jgi:hypothetical protein
MAGSNCNPKNIVEFAVFLHMKGYAFSTIQSYGVSAPALVCLLNGWDHPTRKKGRLHPAVKECMGILRLEHASRETEDDALAHV